MYLPIIRYLIFEWMKILSVKHINISKISSSRHAIRTTRPITDSKGLYFEAKFTKSSNSYSNFMISLAENGVDLPGRHADGNSYSYYSNGFVRHNETVVREPAIGSSCDIIGCGIDENNQCYFTFNGKRLETTYDAKDKILYPIVSIFNLNNIIASKISVNFGEDDLSYNEICLPNKSLNGFSQVLY